MLTEHFFKTRDELFQAVADRCEQLLRDGISANASASFVVPGGTTPAPVFDHLSKTSLDWEHIQIAPSDERWLGANHEHSNQHLIQQTLLINQAKDATLIAMKNNHPTALSGEEDCNTSYQQLHTPIDVVMLGMGPDGHFASLFPETPQTQQALDITSDKHCVAIDATDCAIAGDYTERMSMTLAALTNSNLIILLFTGEAKFTVLQNAKQTKKHSELPVSALLNQSKVPVEVYWAA